MRIVFIITIILILGIGSFFLFVSPQFPSQLRRSGSIPTVQDTEVSESPLQEDAAISSPFTRTVTSIDETIITVSGPQGDMAIPKDTGIVSVSRKGTEGITDASLSDIAVGDTLEVTVVVPGEKVLLLLLDDR